MSAAAQMAPRPVPDLPLGTRLAIFIRLLAI